MITIYEGSIFDVKADAIVNPANGHLRHGGGLARAIDTEAKNAEHAPPRGDKTLKEFFAPRYRWEADHEAAPLIATGNAYTTSPGFLSFKACIHAVGPIYNSGLFMEHDLLELTLDSVYDRCREAGFESVAVPAISCGIFGFPVVEAAEILVAVASYNPDIDPTFALTDPDHVAAFTASKLVLEKHA
jgi:O-acetyl-ADP-ribose deacetylase (regulator of RNase III)